MMKYTKHYNTTATLQNQPIPGREAEMSANNAGGFSFVLDKWGVLDRFLTRGSEGGTYYVSEQKLTTANATNVAECIKEDGLRVVKTIVEISDAGRAPKNSPAIFALALCSKTGDEATRKAANEAITKVCRTGTHLFEFCQYVKDLGGFGRGLRNGVSKFYTGKAPEKMAYQIVKYRQRNGWEHKDVLRLTHPAFTDVASAQIAKWLMRKEGVEVASGSPLIDAFEKAQMLTGSDVKTAVSLITEFGLTWEMLPTELLNSKDVWMAMLPKMPLMAMTRNLGKMTAIGLMDSNISESTKLAVAKLSDVEALKKSRIHPIAVLTALRTYSRGHGFKGSLSWNPNQKIVDALDSAFYASYGNVEPTGKNIMLALDVSGSMSGWRREGVVLSPREITAAIALVTANVEPNYEIMGFATEFVPIKISPKTRLDTVCDALARIPMGGTDCALPMVYAAKKKMPFDSFVVYTDNETYFGNIHPAQALVKFRKEMGIPAKLVVVATEATEFSIADPTDAGMMDCSGFDSTVPQVIGDFIKGGQVS
jgi:60 kDa SS-A/Ro ribonucleoprotein